MLSIKYITKHVILILFFAGSLIVGEKVYGQSIASEDFERTNIFSGSTPATWATTQGAVGFTTTTSSHINGSSSLTFNKPASGTGLPVMSSVLGGSTISYNGSQPAYEWTFLYKVPTTVTPTDANANVVSGDDWRFFFAANGTDPTNGSFKGFYATQDGSAIKFYSWLFGGRTPIGSVSVTAGNTYIIRAVRQSTSGGTFLFYATQYTGPSSFPTTAVGSAQFDQIGSYQVSFFQSSLSSTSNNGAFVWDDLKFYQASATLSGLNAVGTGTGGNGIAAFLTQGDTQKAVFGFQVTALGEITMTQADFSWTTTGSGNSAYFQNAKLYLSSADDVYTPAADDNSIGTVALNSGAAAISGLNQDLVNTTANYFLVVDVQNYSASSAATASIGLTDIKITGNSPINISASIAGTSFTLPATPVTWTGAGTTNAWSQAANWSGGVPSSTGSAVIPSGLSSSHYPQLTAAASVGTVSMNNATIDLNGFNLNVSNSILANGTSAITTTGNTAFLDMTGGSGDRNISGTGLTVSNLKADLPAHTNTLAIFAPLTITNLLSPVTGIISSGGNITLTSTATQSANVDVINTANASITGTVKVQRYFTGSSTATRGYRLLSSPVNSTGTSTGGSSATFTMSNLTNLFTGGPAGTNGGFSIPNSGTSTVFLYREDVAPVATGGVSTSFNSGNYKGFAALNVTPFPVLLSSNTYSLYAGDGVMLYYAGSNNGTNYGTVKTPDNALAVYTGTLNQGNIPVKLWYNASTNFTFTGSNTATGFVLVGNPYASTIDLNTISRTVSTAGIYAPGTGTSSGLTLTFYEYNYTSKLFDTYQATGTGAGTGTATNSGTLSASRYIPSGQGFFVKAYAANATLTFNEAAKVTSQPAKFLMGLPVATNNTPQLLRIKFSQDVVNNQGIVILFENTSTNGYDPEYEADNLGGIGNAVSLSSFAQNSGQPLSINHMHTIDSLTRIRLSLSATTAGVDTLSGSGFESLDPRYDVYLADHYKKDSTLLTSTTKYLFNIILSDTSSFGQTRFELAFHKKASLANYKLLSFTAAKVTGGLQLANSGILLTWKVQNEDKFTGFTIQRADGSLQFLSIYSLQSDGSGTYTYTDRTPLAGVNKYRLMQNGAFDNISYSETVTVDGTAIGDTTNPITLFPNPVVNQLQINLGSNAPSQVHLTIMNAANGIVLVSKDINSANITENVSALSTGTYIAEVSNTTTKTIIGRKKFLKL